MRAVVGIVVGLVASLIVAVIAGIVAFGTTFSPPPGTDASDMRQVLAVLTSIPASTQIALAAAWLASALAGAFVAKLISRKAWVAWTIALLVAAYFGLNAFALPLPLWVKSLWVIAPLVGGLIGNALVRDGAVTEVVVVEDGDAPAEI